MKPLVYYCRWQGAALRLRGRDETAVWGQLVFTAGDGEETTQDFRYLLASAELIILQRDQEKRLFLDDMGVPLEDEQ